MPGSWPGAAKPKQTLKTGAWVDPGPFPGGQGGEEGDLPPRLPTHHRQLAHPHPGSLRSCRLKNFPIKKMKKNNLGPIVLVARAVTGLADLAVPTAIMYVGEVADSNNRSCQKHFPCLSTSTVTFFLLFFFNFYLAYNIQVDMSF